LDLRELSAGTLVANRYRVVEQLGAGGMGAVWIAEHTELGKIVALKVMLPSTSANEDMRNRFVNEARAAAAIGHPNIVDVFDLGFHENCAFIAMERLEGDELENRIQQAGPMSVEEVIRIGIDLADAVGAAHERGIVHRDLKPANVFLAVKGRQRDVVKVLDFGIAKLAQSNSDVHTKTGAVFGSPLYMAPEQLQDAKSVDTRADVYALGGILYTMLAGHPPFNEQTLPQLFFKIVTCAPESLTSKRPDVPEWLDRLVLSALAKVPDGRPLDGYAFRRLLESAGTGQTLPTPAPPPPLSEQRTTTSHGNSAAALTPMYSTAPPALPTNKGGLWLAAGAGVLLLGAAVAVAFAMRAAPGGPAPESTAEAASPAPSANEVVPEKAEASVAAAVSAEEADAAPAASESAAPPAHASPPAATVRKASPTPEVKPKPTAAGKTAPPPLVPR